MGLIAAASLAVGAALQTECGRSYCCLVSIPSEAGATASECADNRRDYMLSRQAVEARRSENDPSADELEPIANPDGPGKDRAAAPGENSSVTPPH
jgi:hypothetical protein